MKMYIEPLSKEALEKYLAIPDLTQSTQPHAIKLVYENIAEYMRATNPQPFRWARPTRSGFWSA